MKRKLLSIILSLVLLAQNPLTILANSGEGLATDPAVEEIYGETMESPIFDVEENEVYTPEAEEIEEPEEEKEKPEDIFEDVFEDDPKYEDYEYEEYEDEESDDTPIENVDYISDITRSIGARSLAPGQPTTAQPHHTFAFIMANGTVEWRTGAAFRPLPPAQTGATVNRDFVINAPNAASGQWRFVGSMRFDALQHPNTAPIESSTQRTQSSNWTQENVLLRATLTIPARIQNGNNTFPQTVDKAMSLLAVFFNQPSKSA